MAKKILRVPTDKFGDYLAGAILALINGTIEDFHDLPEWSSKSLDEYDDWKEELALRFYEYLVDEDCMYRNYKPTKSQI